MATLFISHSSRDGATIAQPLTAALEAAGHRCWIAPRDVKPGRPYPGQIVAAIRDCDGLVLIVTPAANDSPDVLQEVQLAGQHRKTVAPVIVDSTTPSDDLHYYLGVRHQIPWSDAQATTTQLLRSFPAPVTEVTEANAIARTGDIYLAKIDQIDENEERAWIDYGGAELGSLDLADLHPDYFQLPADHRTALLANPTEQRGDRFVIQQQAYSIEHVATLRQVLLVQVTETRDYGAALTTYLALTGRFCRLMPNTPRGIVIAPEIESADERAELEAIATRLEVPPSMTVAFLSTAAYQAEDDIRADYEALAEEWDKIRDRTMASTTPSLIYEEPEIEPPVRAQPLTPADVTALFDVVMLATGPRRIDVVKIIREFTGLGLAEAKLLMESTPPVRLLRGVTYLSAHACISQLRAIGATMLDPAKAG